MQLETLRCGRELLGPQRPVLFISQKGSPPHRFFLWPYVWVWAASVHVVALVVKHGSASFAMSCSLGKSEGFSATPKNPLSQSRGVGETKHKST